MNEDIEWFKRFSKTYLMWVNFNFDRIVADIIRKDAEAEAKRKEDAKFSMPIEKFAKLFFQNNLYYDKMVNDLIKEQAFLNELKWSKGQTLRLRLPNEA